jgi:hypothetical protein
MIGHNQYTYLNMKTIKNIKEQAATPSNPDRDKLYKALQSGCFPKWLKGGKFGTIGDKSVYYGQNSNGDEIVFYADMTAQNMKTKERRNWACDAITNNPLLSTFGIDSKLNEATLLKTLNNVTANLQSYVDKGAVSNIFKQWNDLLTSTYPSATKLISGYKKDESGEFELDANGNKISIPFDDKILPSNAILSTQYNLVPALDRENSWKNVAIYLPKGKTKDLQAGPEGGVKLDTDGCRAILGQYLGAALQYNAKVETTPLPQLSEFRQQLVKCDGAGKFDDFKGFTKETMNPEIKSKLSPYGFLNKKINKRQVFRILSGKTKYLKAPSPYIIGLNESTESNIKSLIKENLTKVKTEKLKTYSAESKIIKSRATIIVESPIINTKPQQERLFNDILTESIYLNSQGFSKHIIQEQFFDTLKGFFDKEDHDSIFDTFKEYMGKWLVSKLTPLHPDGWMSKSIISSIDDVKINDIEKLLDCSYLTKSISKSIIDGSVGKLEKDNDLDGGLYDMVRNNLFDYVNSNDFLNKLESDITKILCPLLNGITEKLEKAHDEIREKAMSN